MSYSLLFDIGNVIVSFDFEISVRRIAPMCSVSPVEIFKNVNELKDDLESGNITPDKFLNEASLKIGYAGDRQFLIDAFQDVFELNIPMVELIQEESNRGTPLYLLSNTNGIHVPYLFEHYPVFRLFNSAVYSHEVRCMKPDAAIFQKTIEMLRVDPSLTIYIDDMAENVEAGNSHGFHAIQYCREKHADFLDAFEKEKRAIGDR